MGHYRKYPDGQGGYTEDYEYLPAKEISMSPYYLKVNRRLCRSVWDLINGPCALTGQRALMCTDGRSMSDRLYVAFSPDEVARRGWVVQLIISYKDVHFLEDRFKCLLKSPKSGR
jgi:hypothetical protein